LNRFVIALLATTAIGATSSAMAADLIIDTPVQAGVVAASGNWDGAFVGVFTGYSAGELTSDTTGVDGTDIDGWLLGVTAGVNFTLTNGIVAGVVGDIAWNNISDDTSGYTSDWNGSLRGRLGYDAGAFLPYVTAGVAFARGEFGGIDNVHVGWTAGAGVEFAVAQDVSLDLQYRYTSYGEETYTVDAGADTHAVTVGLNWRF